MVLRWPLGLAAVSWDYMWRATPVYRVEHVGDRDDLPPPVPADLVDEDVQPVEDGFGPLVHRSYEVTVAGARRSPGSVIADFAADPNRAAPADVAVFVKTVGGGDRIDRGDEFVVRMPGPWDGPVRVVEMSGEKVRLATLREHLEAGQIAFSAHRAGPDLVIRIESWARCGDRLSDLLYNRLRLAKEIQLNLWVVTCLRLARRAGGRPRNGVRVHTRTVLWDDAMRDGAAAHAAGREPARE